MQASQRAVLALAVAVVLAVAVGQEAAAPASAGTPPTHESRRTGAVAERELRSADYAIRRVVFYSPDVSDRCEHGGPKAESRAALPPGIAGVRVLPCLVQRHPAPSNRCLLPMSCAGISAYS